MSGTGWTSADLLTRFNQVAGRPAADSITDAEKYVFLSDGQESVLTEIAGVSPKQLYGAPTAMTSADGGYTWTFGTDGDGYPLFPMGNAQIYPTLDAVPDYPWQPGYDYLDEGVQIRIPNNIQWPGPLYWRGITPPAQITATVQPILQPPPARTLIVTRTVLMFAEQYLRNAALADQMQTRWNREWPAQITMIRRHFRGGSRLGPLTGAFGRGGSGIGFGIGTGFGW